MLRTTFSLILACALLGCGSDQPEPEVAVTQDATAAPSFEADPQPVPKQEVATLVVGSQAPDFNLPGADGEMHSLADYSDGEVIVLAFTANHCPTAQAYEQRLIDFQNDYADKGVQVIAISPNSPLGLLYEELGYTDLNDDYDQMAVRAEYAKFNFPYLYDGDDHAVSLQYGPVATPHMFILDKDRVLRYTGRLDESERPGTANAEDLRAATDALLAGEEVPNPTTPTFGCSTKWAWKTEYNEQSEAKWLARPVTLEEADVEKVKEIVANDSDKLRLINVWATWCGPCVMEYPQFLVLQRMYGARDFEFVSISADKPDQGARALKFLEQVHSGVDNYHFVGENIYKLVEALDPDWNGALPYTLLVEPGGEIVYSHQAEVDFLELKRAIVEHEMMGRVY
ncbi:redoxin domain-containing protein [Neolewinella litorea]|uniref:Redoxin domain-containing protein n=1 Tax=Neolewinella litorea TaxID=2562452 RepID=A0A4S4NSL3_9BACT|nr:redoxin domain-containing protein [Neolewinella litorea]THH41451.1 redoxin domain-containing protein [Neolewinella litorea]